MPSKKPENGVLFEPPEEGVPERPEHTVTSVPRITTREISRLVKFYNTKIKPHTKAQCVGVFRLILGLLDKGIGLDQMATALENYEKDPFRKGNDSRYTKSIRSFFTEQTILEWQTPKPRYTRPVLAAPEITPTTRPEPSVLINPDEEEVDDL